MAVKSLFVLGCTHDSGPILVFEVVHLSMQPWGPESVSGHLPGELESVLDDRDEEIIVYPCMFLNSAAGEFAETVGDDHAASIMFAPITVDIPASARTIQTMQEILNSCLRHRL